MLDLADSDSVARPVVLVPASTDVCARPVVLVAADLGPARSVVLVWESEEIDYQQFHISSFIHHHNKMVNMYTVSPICTRDIFIHLSL